MFSLKQDSPDVNNFLQGK